MPHLNTLPPSKTSAINSFFSGSPLLSVLLSATLYSVAPIAHAQAGQDGAIEKCSVNLGTLAVAEPQSHVLNELTRYKLGSPSVMLRMIAQESGCFTIVERGVGMQNLQQERALAAAGQLQSGSNIGGGQMQAADFVLTPMVQFTGDTGGMAGAVGGLLNRFGKVGAAISGIAGSVSFKEAETTILVADVRSGIQVASAEGQASKMNFSLGGWGWGGMGWASAGGYSKTPEGKLIAASLLDNYNRIVQQVRNKPSLIQASSASSQNNARGSIQATGGVPAPAPAPVYAAPPPAAPVYVAPVRQQSQMMQSGTIPTELTGRFACQITGGAQGIATLMITPEGLAIGMATIVGAPATMSAGGMGNLQGNVSSTGQIMLANSNGMGQGQVTANGKIDGSWTGAGGEKGTLACNRN